MLDALVGACLVLVIALGARRSPAPTPSSTPRLVGWALVAVPLPLAVALHLFVWRSAGPDQAAFVIGAVAFAAGAFLVLANRDDQDGGDPADDLEPAPWWPDFEREFREYERRSSRPRVRV
jgi:hypothetical protein